MKEGGGGSARSKGKGLLAHIAAPLRKLSSPSAQRKSSAPPLRAPVFRLPSDPDDRDRWHSVGDPAESVVSLGPGAELRPPDQPQPGHSRSDEGLMRGGGGGTGGGLGVESAGMPSSKSASALPPYSAPPTKTTPDTARPSTSQDTSEGRPRSNSDGDSREGGSGAPGAAKTPKDEATKKKRSFAISKKISFFRRGTEQSLMPGGGGREDVVGWSKSFEALLASKTGLQLFKAFLEREFSDENIDFWIAVEEYRRCGAAEQLAKAEAIYAAFVAVQSPKEVNLDSWTRAEAKEAVQTGAPAPSVFDNAQHRIQNLMEKDSFPRFIKSDLYLAQLKK